MYSVSVASSNTAPWVATRSRRVRRNPLPTLHPVAIRRSDGRAGNRIYGTVASSPLGPSPTGSSASVKCRVSRCRRGHGYRGVTDTSRGAGAPQTITLCHRAGGNFYAIFFNEHAASAVLFSTRPERRSLLLIVARRTLYCSPYSAHRGPACARAAIWLVYFFVSTFSIFLSCDTSPSLIPALWRHCWRGYLLVLASHGTRGICVGRCCCLRESAVCLVRTQPQASLPSVPPRSPCSA